jgi:hypothetical protein
MPSDNDNLNRSIQKMQEDILINRRLLQDLIKILAPVFPSERVSLSSSLEIEQASNQGKFIFKYMTS